MKPEVKKISKYQSKFDNEFFEIIINSKSVGTFEKSEIRHLIETLDLAIHH